MESKRFIVYYERPNIRGASRLMLRSHFYNRATNQEYDFVFMCSNNIHLSYFHGPKSKQKTFRIAQKRLEQRYMPRLFRMIFEGVKCERF